jgi:hypothetical protein
MVHMNYDIGISQNVSTQLHMYTVYTNFFSLGFFSFFFGEAGREIKEIVWLLMNTTLFVLLEYLNQTLALMHMNWDIGKSNISTDVHELGHR